MSRCSICTSEAVEAIDADLRAGLSIRVTARKWLVSRPALARHRKHVMSPTEPPVARGRSQLQAALDELEAARGGPVRAALAAQAAARSAITLELQNFRAARSSIRAPNDEELVALERALEDAWGTFERCEPGSDLARRALEGIRSAERTLRQAEARLPVPPGPPVTGRVCLSDGTLLFETEWASEVVEDVPPSGRLRLVLPARIPNEVFVADTPESGNGSGSS
jgi:hypothetical protein